MTDNLVSNAYTNYRIYCEIRKSIISAAVTLEDGRQKIPIVND